MKKNNKIYLENIISKLPKTKGTISGYLWRTSQIILENLEILLKNAEKYNINIHTILSLRSELFSLYVNICNISKAQQMFDWFNQKDKEFKLWQMSESQKFYYARYLGIIGTYQIIGTYHYRILKNFETSIIYSPYVFGNNYVNFVVLAWQPDLLVKLIYT